MRPQYIGLLLLLLGTLIANLVFWGYCRRCACKECHKEDSVGEYKNGKKQGQWVNYKNGQVTERNFYLNDTILYSVRYSSDGNLMFVQSFVGTLWQTIFDSAAYKRQVLNIVPYEISESKGQHIYISYCASCHHKVFELVKSKNYPSRDLTMFHYLNTAHPIVRFNFDSSDIKSLRAYFEPSLDKGEDFDSN